MTTFTRACPVSLSRKPLSPGIEATPKTDLSLSRSLVHRQTWRLTGEYHLDVKVVWHDYHIASVPVMARGACQTWGTLGDPQNTLPQ